LVSLASFQDADAPLLLPAAGEPDGRFDWFSAWERVATPRALELTAPLGSEAGALTYNAQAFGDDNPARGGRHTGDDLNGIGGMNTDLGDPVFAVADGLVVFAGAPSPGWGNVVVLNHRVADGRMLQSMYAHLDRIDVRPGRMVARGEPVGTVGSAGGQYPAHLHFELREAAGVTISGAYRDHARECLPAMATLAGLGAVDTPDLRPSVLALVERGSELGLGPGQVGGELPDGAPKAGRQPGK
jgi:murein DD-endopeptidase MepM/ murein hydrolase activator NlpD